MVSYFFTALEGERKTFNSYSLEGQWGRSSLLPGGSDNRMVYEPPIVYSSSESHYDKSTPTLGYWEEGRNVLHRVCAHSSELRRCNFLKSYSELIE